MSVLGGSGTFANPTTIRPREWLQPQTIFFLVERDLPEVAVDIAGGVTVSADLSIGVGLALSIAGSGALSADLTVTPDPGTVVGPVSGTESSDTWPDLLRESKVPAGG